MVDGRLLIREGVEQVKEAIELADRGGGLAYREERSASGRLGQARI